MRASVLVLLLTFASLRSGSPASPAGIPKGTLCWPLNFAGITIGVNTDSQVRRLLGKGAFRQDEGHTGGRYFIDVNHTATLHIVEGVDQVVEELTVAEAFRMQSKFPNGLARPASGLILASLLGITTLCSWVRAKKRSSRTSESHREGSTPTGGNTNQPVRAKYRRT